MEERLRKAKVQKLLGKDKDSLVSGKEGRKKPNMMQRQSQQTDAQPDSKQQLPWKNCPQLIAEHDVT